MTIIITEKKNIEKVKFSALLIETETSTAIMDSIWRLFIKLKSELPYDPAV